MGKIYISESEITDKISEISVLSGELSSYIEEFTSYISEIQELLIGLKVCLNTTGGVSRIKELANIDFDTVAINNIIPKIEDIKVVYEKNKQYIDTN